MDRLIRLHARLVNRQFLASARLQALLHPRAGMRILFSPKDGWDNNIKKGFLRSRHQIAFEKLSPESLARHDLIVPLTIADLKYLNQVRDLVNGNPLPIPSMESVALCDDKYLFNQAMLAGEFADSIPRVCDAGAQLAYPYVLKKKIDEWGKNCHIITEVAQERSILQSIAAEDYFSQELVPGRYEYATHILFKGGKIVYSLNMEYTFAHQRPIKGKDEPICKKICGCRHLDLFAGILLAIGFEGICCVNYKLLDGRPLIFEINPRFGGSLCLYFFAFVRFLS